MKRLVLVMLVLYATFSLVACQDTTQGTFDQTWITEFHLNNQSDSALVATTFGSGCTLSDTIQAKTDCTIRRFEDFLAPGPRSPSTSFSCISIRLLSDAIVYQMSPMIDDTWQSEDIGAYALKYTLTITDEDLNLDGLEDHCR